MRHAGFSLVWVLSGLSLSGQTFGTIAGQILDSSQSSLAMASVMVSNEDTGATRQMSSDASGRYAFPSLPMGVYQVFVEHIGFTAQRRSGIQLGVGESVTLDFTLAPGSVTSEVEVRGDAPIVDASETLRSTTIGGAALMDLPINGRDFTRFSLLTPGAVARTNQIADLTFNGAQTTYNAFSIDGINATQVVFPYVGNGLERGARLQTGSLESVSEFRVQTSNYSAEYGRASAAWVNIASKAGTNQWHGTLFEYFRNNILDARNFFNAPPAPPAPFRYNDFGGNLSGPIRRNNTFFFLNYEGSHQRIGVLASGTVPSDLLRQQALLTSPALTPVLSMMPRGTGPTGDDRVNTYTTEQSLAIGESTGSIKIDHRFSDRNSIYGRLNVNDSQVMGPLFSIIPGAFGLLDHQDVPIRTTNFAVGDQHIYSPRLINDFTTGMQRFSTLQSMDRPQQPLVFVTGLTIQPGSRGTAINNSTSYQVRDAFTFQTHGHTLKWGGTASNVRLVERSLSVSVLTYASLADFIQNSVAAATLIAGDPGSAVRAWEASGSVQDAWRIRSGLSADFGLRYDYFPPPFDPIHRARTYDEPTGQLAAPGSSYFNTDHGDIAPRVGVAWQALPRLVLRAGYGIFYDPYPPGNGFDITRNTLGNTTLVRQQIPSLSYPIGPFMDQGMTVVPSVSEFDRQKRDSYLQQWNLTAAIPIGGKDALEIAYVGDHGVRLRRVSITNLFDPALGRRPNPLFANIYVNSANGNSAYNALQASWRRRLSAGLEGSFNYTWSHVIDDVQDQGLFAPTPQNSENLAAERGNGSGDARHNVSYTFLYDLPFGTATSWGAWKLAGVGLLRTGIAETILIGTNTSGDGNFTNQRPDAVAGVNPYAATKTVGLWFNPAAFRLPSPGTFGNLARNSVFGPGLAQIDLSLLKETRIRESLNLQVRAEIFNVMNRPNFSQPNNVFGTGAFGQIFSTLGNTIGMGTARQVQLALRLSF